MKSDDPGASKRVLPKYPDNIREKYGKKLDSWGGMVDNNFALTAC
jgi:hypothetical protein